MHWDVVEVKPEPHYRLFVRFKDGVSGYLQLRPEDLKRRGKHPALGVVTLAELLATWAVHDLTHMHQLSRIMSYQYRAAVGPWKRFLGVLHCDGHSAP